MANHRSRVLRRHLTVLALFTILAVALTWPLVGKIATHAPGTPTWAFDEATFVWNIWQLKHSAIDNLASPLHSELIYYPLGIDLVLYTYNFYHAFASLPMALASNLVFASNVSLLLSTILSGYGTWLLVRYLLNRGQSVAPAVAPTRSTPSRTRTMSQSQLSLAAFLAGLVFAFASNRAVYAMLGHYDMVTTQWIPFYALLLLRSLDARLTAPRRRTAALLAGVFFAFNGLTEMITALFLAIFTVIVLVTFVTHTLVTHKDGDVRRARPALLAPRIALPSLLIIGVVAALVWGPVLGPILVQFLTNDFSLKGWGEAIPLSTDLLGWFTPTVLHPLWGGNLAQELRRVQLRALEMGVTGFRDVNTVFLGWVTLALAIVGAVTARRQVRLWTWSAVIFGLFTLGPFLQINGRYRFDLDGVEATFPMPFALLHYLPIIKANRAPNRNSVILMLALAVLVGYGVHWLAGRFQRKDEVGGGLPVAGRRPPLAAPRFLVIGALAVALLFEHLALPAPLSDLRIPAVYQEIAADPRPVSVMQVPLGWRNSFGVFGPEQTIFQYYQSAHGKPMLGGNISRAPDFKLDYFQRLAYFQALTEIEFGRPVDPAVLQAAKAQAGALAQLYNLGYVILYPPIPDKPPYTDTWQSAWQFTKETLPLEREPFWRGDGIEAYRVKLPAPVTDFRLDLGAPGAFAYRGAGWDTAEVDQPYSVSAIWATERSSQLFAPPLAANSSGYRVRVRVRPFDFPGSPSQSVTLLVNGKTQGAPQTLTNDWQELEWSTASSTIDGGITRLELVWGYTAIPRTVLSGSRTIGASGVELPVDADLKAFADGGYIALFDDAGEPSDGSAGRLGVNVTVLDPASGAVLSKLGFDTTANSFESDALAAALAQVPPGQIVLVVSHGDATAHLTPEAVNRLAGLGADVTLDSLRGQSFAIIGVQGAQRGAAVQVIDSNEAFLRLSLNRDRRTLAAAVDWVEIGE